VATASALPSFDHKIALWRGVCCMAHTHSLLQVECMWVVPATTQGHALLTSGRALRAAPAAQAAYLPSWATVPAAGQPARSSRPHCGPPAPDVARVGAGPHLPMCPLCRSIERCMEGGGIRGA